LALLRAPPGATLNTEDLYHFKEDEEEFTEEQTNRFLKTFSANSPRNQPHQNNINPEIGVIGVDRC
jgi:hypothetical protein